MSAAQQAEVKEKVRPGNKIETKKKAPDKTEEMEGGEVMVGWCLVGGELGETRGGSAESKNMKSQCGDSS